jgi:AcrR family transcriptional regulator
MIIRKQLRRHLRNRRRRSVVDNLVDRVRAMLKAGEVALPERREVGPLASGGRRSTDVAIRDAACLVAQIPRVPIRRDHAVYGAERAPVVFTAANLKLAVETIAKTLGGPVGLDEIRAVLSSALTDLIATDLLPFEDMAPGRTGNQHPGIGESLMAAPSLPAADLALVRETIDAILERLSMDDRTVLLHKMADEADGLIAKRLGVSRPTAAKRKEAVFRSLHDQLEDLSERVQQEVLEGIYVRLLEDL